MTVLPLNYIHMKNLKSKLRNYILGIHWKGLIFYILVRRKLRRIKRQITFAKSFRIKLGSMEMNYIEKRKRPVWAKPSTI